MIHNISIPSFALVILVCTAVYGAGTERPFVFDRMFFGGLNTAFNSRQGNLVFSDQYSQNVNSPNLYTFGVTAGKRFPLSADLRIAIPLSLDYGSLAIDSFYDVNLTNGEVVDVIKKARYYHTGISPVIQLPFKVNIRANLYLCAGGGVHMLKYLEIMHQLGNPLGRVNSDFLEHGRAFSLSADAGIGYELIVSKRYGVAFQYNFRYWNPVKYKTSRDGLFLYKPVTYKEKFLTHSFQVLLLGY